LVWGVGLSLGGSTGYAINPARDLGPRIAHAILPISGKGTWFMRRLAERPANLWFVVRNLFNFH
jgi:glycerol uptake facilitator-like aquaporin